MPPTADLSGCLLDLDQPFPPAMAEMLDRAAVVALGEPTHGQAEMNGLRARITQAMIQDYGCDTVGFEAPAAGWARIDAALRSGRPVTRTDTGYWMYDTVEVLDLVEWIRDFPDARVMGFDLEDTLSVSWTERDGIMARNILALVEEGRRVVLWAHNGHNTRDAGWLFDPGVATLGMHLAGALGDRYIAIGGAFGTGSFTAHVIDGDIVLPRTAIAVDAPAPESLDGMLLAASGGRTGVLPLRTLRSDVRSGLDHPLATRTAGAGVGPGDDHVALVNPVACYDAIAFVPHTTAFPEQ